jgi:hypothetical protein
MVLVSFLMFEFVFGNFKPLDISKISSVVGFFDDKSTLPTTVQHHTVLEII